MTIYEALKKDHAKVKALLDRLVNLKEGAIDERAALVDQIRDELIPHARAEEAVFYNSIRAINTAQDIVWHGYEEHMEAEALLRTIQGLTAINVESRKLAEKLRDALTKHIEEEEGQIFTVAQHLFTREEAEAMAEAFVEMKPDIREGNIMQTTLDMIANVMPTRLAAPMRSFTFKH